MIELTSPYHRDKSYVNYWDIVAIVPNTEYTELVLRGQTHLLPCKETSAQVFELMKKERERINNLCNAKRES